MSNQEKFFCSEHPKVDTKYFCKQCKVPICNQCVFSKHNGHILTDKNPLNESMDMNQNI